MIFNTTTVQGGGGISGWEDVSNLVTVTSLWDDTSTLEIPYLLALLHDYGDGNGSLVLAFEAADSQGMNIRISLDESIWPQTEYADLAIFNAVEGGMATTASWGDGDEPNCFEAHDDSFNHLLYSTQLTVGT